MKEVRSYFRRSLFFFRFRTRRNERSTLSNFDLVWFSVRATRVRFITPEDACGRTSCAGSYWTGPDGLRCTCGLVGGTGSSTKNQIRSDAKLIYRRDLRIIPRGPMASFLPFRFRACLGPIPIGTNLKRKINGRSRSRAVWFKTVYPLAAEICSAS